MKLTINSKALLKALQTVGSVINYSHSMPILQNFKFEITDTLKITATDLDTTLSCVIDATGEGSLCIPAKLIIDALKALPDQAIELSSEGSVLLLTALSGKYKLPCTDATEFPQSIIIKEPSTITLPAEILAEGINKTAFATSDDQLRPIMCGVLFRLTNQGLTFAATNGHKLSEYKRYDISSSDERDFVVHKKTINILKNMIVQGELKIVCNAIHATFFFDNCEFTTRLLEGKFVGYEAVIPRQNHIKVIASKSELLNSFKRVGLFSNAKSNEMALHITPGNINIKSTDVDYATDAEENVPTDYDGEPIRIGFSHRIFSEALTNMNCDNVIIELSQPNRAAVIFQEDGLDEGESVLMLVMPMMLA